MLAQSVGHRSLVLFASSAAALLALCACGDRSGLLDGAANPIPIGRDASVATDRDASVGIARDAAAADAAPCGAPWIVFSLITSGDTSPKFQLYARRADGTEGHLLTFDRGAMYPSASPDGASLLYTDGAVTHLFLVRLVDRNVQTLGTTGRVGHGSLSPDGKTVVYGDGGDILTVGVSDGASRLLVSAADAPGNAAGYPVFLRDSQTVIFAASGALQSIRTDGSGSQTLLRVDDADGPAFPNPTLSPDFTQLAAIVSCAGEMPALRVYSLGALPAACTDGRVVTTMSQRLNYYDPAWGPTGLIAYSGGRDIYFVAASGGAPTNFTADLTLNNGSAQSPTWVPGCVSSL